MSRSRPSRDTETRMTCSFMSHTQQHNQELDSIMMGLENDTMSTALVPLGVRQASNRHSEAGPSNAGRLCVVEHTVHKMGKAPDGADELVVSTLKPFGLVVGLFGGDDLLIEDHDPMQLEAQLLFEDGTAVPLLEGATALTGGYAMLSGGRATFKIRLNVLSSQRECKRFRIRVEASSLPRGVTPAAKGVVTQPMRTLTKLFRGPRSSPPAAAAQQAQDAAGAPLDDGADASADGLPQTVEALRALVRAHSEELDSLRKDRDLMWREVERLKRLKPDETGAADEHAAKRPRHTAHALEDAQEGRANTLSVGAISVAAISLGGPAAEAELKRQRTPLTEI
mmetsp:Transcript_34065/g.100123  ORF Transcript_34065/g.100123 Transcript_34065/m.100123 type:complete len:339 (-) Transcript_34065:374-1390(-)